MPGLITWPDDELLRDDEAAIMGWPCSTLGQAIHRNQSTQKMSGSSFYERCLLSEAPLTEYRGTPWAASPKLRGQLGTLSRRKKPPAFQPTPPHELV